MTAAMLTDEMLRDEIAQLEEDGRKVTQEIRKRKEMIREARLQSEKEGASKYVFSGRKYFEVLLRGATTEELMRESQTFALREVKEGVGTFVFSANGHPPRRWAALLRGLKKLGIPSAAVYEKKKGENWQMHFSHGAAHFLAKGLTPVIIHADGEEPTVGTLGNAQKLEFDFGQSVEEHYPNHKMRHVIYADFFFDCLGFRELLAEAKASLETARTDIDAELPLVDDEDANLEEYFDLATELREFKKDGEEFIKVVEDYRLRCATAVQNLEEAENRNKLKAQHLRAAAEAEEKEAEEHARLAAKMAQRVRLVQNLESKERKTAEVLAAEKQKVEALGKWKWASLGISFTAEQNGYVVLKNAQCHDFAVAMPALGAGISYWRLKIHSLTHDDWLYAGVVGIEVPSTQRTDPESVGWRSNGIQLGRWSHQDSSWPKQGAKPWRTADEAVFKLDVANGILELWYCRLQQKFKITGLPKPRQN